MATVLETTIRHASGSLELVEGTALVQTRDTVGANGAREVVTSAVAPKPVPEAPTVTLTAPPRDLETVSRKGRLILWRTRPPELHVVVGGRASDADLERPAEVGYQLSGQIRFASGRYHPRLFTVTAGGGASPSIPIFRAVSAIAGDGGGVLSARLRYQDGRPASWAVVTARLDLPVADTADVADRTYRAQADRRGELRLALTGLPAPSKALVDAGDLERGLTLSVSADPTVADTEVANPDGFAAMQIQAPDSAAFDAEARFAIRPGGVIRIASEDQDHLTLRTIP